jgi:hypothetical protein
MAWNLKRMLAHRLAKVIVEAVGGALATLITGCLTWLATGIGESPLKSRYPWRERTTGGVARPARL